MALQDKESALPSSPSEQRWCPPSADVCKVNFDAAVFRSSNSAGLGVVMCDSNSAVIGALSVPTFLGSSVAELEALACLRAMQFALDIGLTRVIFEGDSATVINALRQGLGELTCYGNVLDDIRAHVSDF